VADDELLGIGAFSLLTGLSITALRHYDDTGVLPPAFVDGTTGYRRYRRAQVGDGRLVAALRAVDLPLDQVRAVLQANDDGRRALLAAHRAVLASRRDALGDMLATLDDYIEKGVGMAALTGCRIVEVNIGVDDLEPARRFYEAAFDVSFVEDRHDGGHVHLMASFGTWPSDQFFLLNLDAADRFPDRVGKGNFGFLVDDLDATHKRAVAAGGTEVVAPHDASGMPRTSTIDDPSGNRVNLYQGS
jgi:DNA-binding transcriptional MerR regulator